MGQIDDTQLQEPVESASPAGNGKPWYAIRVKPNYEKRVATAIHGKGLEEFLPLYRSKRQWSDRTKILDMPLFPGYVFCRLDLDARLPLLTTPGFLYIVGTGKNPLPVDDAEIAAIQSVLRSGVPAKPWPNLVVGQRVQIHHGPLRGIVGVLTKIANQHRLYVSVMLLKRSISVEIAPEWVRPAHEPHGLQKTNGASTTEGVLSGSKLRG